MAVDDAYVFPGFLTPVLTPLFFPKPPTTFLTCFCRGERRKCAGKKSRLNRGSNSTTRSWVQHAHHWPGRGKVKVKYQGHVSQKMGFFRGISVSQTHLVVIVFSTLLETFLPFSSNLRLMLGRVLELVKRRWTFGKKKKIAAIVYFLSKGKNAQKLKKNSP